MIWGAQSWAGPLLCGLGVVGLAGGGVVHGLWGKPAIWRTREWPGEDAPSRWERLSVHLVVMGAWSLWFGAFVWRGPAVAGWDVRLPGEAAWPVWAPAEWVYLLGYATPLVLAWIAPTRAVLRRVSVRLAWVAGVSGLCFWFLPVVSPPRAWESEGGGLTERLLAWELGRADFAAASLPSFHVLWALLLASVVAGRGGSWALAARVWPVVMSAACVLNGAHALADVAASWVVWAVVGRWGIKSQSAGGRGP